MKLRVLMPVLFLFAFLGVAGTQSQTAPPVPEPDSRYKVDILVIVGHPDDDVEVAGVLIVALPGVHVRGRLTIVDEGLR